MANPVDLFDIIIHPVGMDTEAATKELHEIVEESVDLEAAAVSVAEHLLAADEYEMICRYSWQNDIDENDVDLKKEETRQDFNDFVSSYAAERVRAALSELSWELKEQDGKIAIWRSIIVAPDWLQNGIHERPLGVFWSYKEEAAEAHWGYHSANGHKEIRLHGLVPMEDIDWQTSLVVNAHREEERELRLKETATVELVSATWLPRSRDGKSVVVDLVLTLPAGQEAHAEPEMRPL